MPKIATKGDKVVGTDIHIVLVPSPSGATPTPLPHPFSGTIHEGCCGLTINGRPIAVSGCSATNDQPHTPAPPGTSFQKPPSNKGKVVTSVMPLFEIDGHPIIVEGSPAITCNDPADAPTSLVQVIHPDTWQIEPNTAFTTFTYYSPEEEKRMQDVKKKLEEKRLHILQKFQPKDNMRKNYHSVGKIHRIEIAPEEIFVEENITVTVYASGYFDESLYLRMYYIDGDNKRHYTGLERPIQIEDGMAQIEFPVPMPDFKGKEMAPGRLGVGFEVWCLGDLFRGIQDNETREVFFRGILHPLDKVQELLRKEKLIEDFYLDFSDCFHADVEFDEIEEVLKIRKASFGRIIFMPWGEEVFITELRFQKWGGK